MWGGDGSEKGGSIFGEMGFLMLYRLVKGFGVEEWFLLEGVEIV